MNSSDTKETGGKPTIKRDMAYQKMASHFDEALAVIVKNLQSRNEAIALGAANKIIDKIVPNLKGVEITGADGEAIAFKIIAGATYYAALDKSSTASTDGTDYGLSDKNA